MNIITFREEVRNELENDILPFWITRMVDNEHSGFYGEITGDGELVPDSSKGAVLNARILWTFSAAYRLLHRQVYLEMATRAKHYLINYFYDKEYGGIYWELNANGTPKDTKKQIYAIGFAIYGLSEYYRATGKQESLDYAIKLFNDIETYSFDKEKNGYIEALTREWGKIADVRLSDKDANEKKTMNTHLHILEPYTNLYRVWKNDRLKKQIHNLIDIFTEKILNRKTFHLELFFDEDWNSKYHIESYGHDIEASWLLHEAALVLNDKIVLEKVEKVVPLIAKAASEGLTPEGAMIHEKNNDTNTIDADLHWWVQCETVIGYLNIYQHYGDEDALRKSLSCWEYIKNNLIDRKNGEWFWSRNADGTINTIDDKAGFWKCPYHNTRMCLEVINRTQLKTK